jgi:hypothetical protein
VLARSEEDHSLDFLSDFPFLQVFEVGGNKIRYVGHQKSSPLRQRHSGNDLRGVNVTAEIISAVSLTPWRF